MVSGGSSLSGEGQPTDQKLVAQARKAANAKARELGWIL